MLLVPPVEAPIVRPFSYEGSPFAAGLHRGIDYGAPPGLVVRAPCSGELVWASQDVVTLVCGRRRVTLVDFAASAAVGPVRAGDPVGRTGSSPLHLGVRRPGDPFGYEDPERYLQAEPPPVAPVAPAPRRLRLPPRLDAEPPRAAPAAELAPPLAWAGVVAIAMGIAGRRQLALRRGQRRAAAVRTVRIGHRSR